MTKDQEESPLEVGELVDVIDGDFAGNRAKVHRLAGRTIGVRFDPGGPVVWLPAVDLKRVGS
ncbi:hypothetical protein F0L68_20900 [Solihabitans fulvus]|uniref:DUF1918 domain-containing protein n=1 Tax=Solihabitans fulvus TaxID=1892852 RepID=A0A5B2X835_9PSEU|nr:hypothetical protein [Solihabitans fulvus]KAA2259405.1 hypothetical protein F0L68_20900 [Solihabitans fulvus]